MYILVIALSAVAIKVTISLDLNAWLERRREAKMLAHIGKRAKRCRHAWTLHPNNTFSQCAMCLAWIPTAILITARELLGDGKLIILAEYHGEIVPPKGVIIVVHDYIGAEA